MKALVALYIAFGWPRSALLVKVVESKVAVRVVVSHATDIIPLGKNWL